MLAHLKYPLIALIALLLNACTSSVVWHGGLTKAPYKLIEARIIWIENPNMRIMVYKRGMGNQPIISDAENLNASFIARNMLSQFQHFAVDQLGKELAREGVASGHKVILEIRPEVASVTIGEYHTLAILATIKEQESGKAIWSTPIQSTSNLFFDKDNVMVGQFVDNLVVELRQSGWLIES